VQAEAAGRHYQRALDLLQGNLADTICQTMLLIALTLVSGHVMPEVESGEWKPQSRGNRDRAQWVVHLVLRMMWYLYPDDFSLKNTGGVMGITDMLRRVGE
jgi:hypothetical protein